MEKEMKEEELFIPKTKHKGLKVTLAILLIAALGVLGYFLYQEKFNNPKTTVINAIEEAEKDLGNVLNMNDDTSSKYKINGLLQIDATLPNELKELAKVIRNIDLQFSGEIDSQNSIANVTLNTKYKNEQMVDIKTYYEKDNLYILLDGLYDKYLKVSLNDISNGQTNVQIPEIDIDTKDIETLSTSLINAFRKAIDELEFIKEDTKIIIDGKEYSVTNNYTVLKGKDVNKLAKNIITTLSNDNEFKTVFKKLTNEDADKALDELLKNIDEQQIQDTIKINFYTKGLLKQRLVSIRFSTTNEDETVEINFDKISDNETMTTIKANGMEVSVKIKKTNSIANFNITADIMGMKFKIDLNTNYEKIKEITKPDIENSKEFAKLTQEEAKSIEEKLIQNKAVKAFIEDVQKINLNIQ